MKKYYPCFLVFGLLLSGCNFSLAQDVTPPPDYQPQPAIVQADSTPSQLYPLLPPDPSTGKAVYQEKCAPCHGEIGLGDGSRARDLPNPVIAIGSSDVVRDASPVEWFNIVTQGNLQQSMPPFSSLTNRQRWDVVSYVFRLSESQGTLSEGERVYKNQCLACHGKTGKGDGEKAGNLHMPDFTRQELMASKSNSDFFTSISAGISPEMPAFSDKLSETERWDVVDYIRSFSFAKTFAVEAAATPYPGVPYPQLNTPSPGLRLEFNNTPSTVYPGVLSETVTSNPLTPTAVISYSIGQVTGIVTNETSGQIPIGSEIILHAFDEMQLVFTATARIKQDGVYSFDQVAFTPDRSFFTMVDFQNVTYSSDMRTVQNGQSRVELPIQVFDSIHDTSVISADRVHYFFDLTDPASIQIIELFIISNKSLKTLVAAAPDQPVVEYNLPVQAFNLKFQDGQLGGRFIKTKNGFGDITPIRPGSGAFQVLFSYQLPYDRKLDLVSQMPMDAKAVIVLVPEVGLKVNGAALKDAGTRDVEGIRYHMYSGPALKMGEKLNLTISGHPSMISSSLALFSDSGFVFGLGVLGIVLIVTGVWLFGRSRASRQLEIAMVKPIPQEYDTSEAVMDAILALDDLFQGGQLPEEAYLQRRGELKARLRELMPKHG